MTSKKKPNNDQGNSGVNINSKSLTVHGDVVGRDKITSIKSGSDSDDMTMLIKLFAQVQEKIDKRKSDPQVDKTELKNLVENIQRETAKGDEANIGKIERWLRFLAEMADDIFQVTVATLTNPVSGTAKAIQLIAQKAKEKPTE